MHLYVLPRSLRSADQMLCSFQRRNVNSEVTGVFAVAAPKLWNDFPLHVRQAPSLTVFEISFKYTLLLPGLQPSVGCLCYFYVLVSCLTSTTLLFFYTFYLLSCVCLLYLVLFHSTLVRPVIVLKVPYK